MFEVTAKHFWSEEELLRYEMEQKREWDNISMIQGEAFGSVTLLLEARRSSGHCLNSRKSRQSEKGRREVMQHSKTSH